MFDNLSNKVFEGSSKCACLSVLLTWDVDNVCEWSGLLIAPSALMPQSITTTQKRRVRQKSQPWGGGGEGGEGGVGLDPKLLWALCRFISLTMQWGGPLCSLDLGPGSKSKCVIGAICGHKYTPTASHNLNTKKQHFVLWILRIEWSVTQSLNTIQNRVQFTLNLLQDRVYKALMLFGDAIY